MDEEVKRSRAKKKLLRVTFPNGKVICYNNATSTMIAVLNEIGEDRFSSIKLDLCHLPLLSKEIYPKYQKDMKPICEGWYLNAQSNSDTKFLQLKAINEQLELGLKIELGADFKTLEEPEKERKTRGRDKLLVKMPDGEFIANDSALETFLEVIWNLGIEDIRKKDLSWSGNPLITSKKMVYNQVQIDNDRWIIVPNTTKEKVKLLRVIGAMLHVKMDHCCPV
jgi:hypothetical protein